MTLVTVIVPCRNEEEHLPEQLAALAAQDYDGDWELVFTDDGSTDGTRRLIEHWADQVDMAVRIVDGPQQGAGPARNAAAAHARGGILAFCDADDVVDRRWLRELVAALENAKFVAGVLERASLNNGVTGRPKSSEHHLPARSSNMAITAEGFHQLGGFDPLFHQAHDTDFSLRASAAGIEPKLAEGATVHYRYRRPLRDQFRQSAAMGEDAVYLATRHGRGTTRQRAIGRQLFWLLTRSPLLLWAQRRPIWIWNAGRLVGWARGRARVGALQTQLTRPPKPSAESPRR